MTGVRFTCSIYHKVLLYKYKHQVKVSRYTGCINKLAKLSSVSVAEREPGSPQGRAVAPLNRAKSTESLTESAASSNTKRSG